jgi:hypothetical protein
VAHHPQAHVEAGRPGAHGERVDRDEGLGPKGVPGEEADVAVGDFALATATDPVVRCARGAARLVDRGAREWDRACNAAIQQAESVDIAALVCLRKAIKDAKRKQSGWMNACIFQEPAVRRNLSGGAPGGSLGPKLAEAGEDWRGRPLEQRLQPAVPQANGAERGVEGKQPDAAPETDERRRQIARCG